MVEWSITVVLKTTVLRGTGGSNPSLSANKNGNRFGSLFFVFYEEGSRPYNPKHEVVPSAVTIAVAIAAIICTINLMVSFLLIVVLFLNG